MEAFNVGGVFGGIVIAAAVIGTVVYASRSKRK
jgi:hypothetical protein